VIRNGYDDPEFAVSVINVASAIFATKSCRKLLIAWKIVHKSRRLDPLRRTPKAGLDALGMSTGVNRRISYDQPIAKGRGPNPPAQGFLLEVSTRRRTIQ
jgi:hypothetical protein